MQDDTPRIGVFNNSEFWAGAVGLALSLWIVWYGHSIGLGTINDPGSGYVLFYTGILMSLFSLGILVPAFREGGRPFRALFADVNWRKPLVIIVSLIIYAVVLETVGFLIATVPLMVLLLRAIDPVAWPRAIAIAVLAPVIVWWVLNYGLLIQLPSGILNFG